MYEYIKRYYFQCYMAENIYSEISDLLNKNTGYKFNTWLNTSAKEDIYMAYMAALGENPTVKLHADNLFYALKAFFYYNSELHIKEYQVFLETIIELQINCIKLV